MERMTEKATDKQKDKAPVDVSVVVPVFNGERHLKQCVDSLLCQTLRNVEFIFVDDGSTDRSMEFLRGYRKRDDRIRILTQRNQYAGVARNNGMEEATGKYIIFLDSDDFFLPTMLEEAYEHAEKHQAEITIFGYSKYDDRRRSVLRPPLPRFPKTCFSVRRIGEDFFLMYNPEPWNKLFLRSFITEHELRFQNIRKCNDTYFTHMAAYLSDRIVFLRKRLVFYRMNNAASLQGNVNAELSAFVPMEAAIKRGLADRQLYRGVEKKAYLKDLCRTISSYGHADADADSYREYYDRVREALIPDLFDSADDFSSDEWVKMLYESDNLESFLLYYIRDLKQNRISKKSKDYILGHAQLVVPRRIKRAAANRSLAVKGKGFEK